jgi:tetratricopeptide (TPR) repeat protein
MTQSYGQSKMMHFCPKCNQPLTKIAVGNLVEPFWGRLHKFFVYPFHPRPLLLMIILSFLFTLVAGPGFLNLMLQGLIWCIILKYSFAALRNTANCDLSPPRINSETVSGDFGVIFKQIVLYIIIGIAFGFVAKTAGLIVGFLFLGFVVLSIPAMIIVLVGTESLIAALNPMIFVTMAWRIGWGYLLMYLFLILLGAAPSVIGHYIISYLPEVSHLFLYTLAKSFYTVVSYHLMGYVILQYHEEIGYEVELADEDVFEPQMAPDQTGERAILNSVEILIREGKTDEAISLIQEQTGGKIADLHLAERYFDLLKIKQMKPEILAHGPVYLDLLAKTDQKEKLWEVYSECISMDANFAASPSTHFKIASLLNETGDAKGAIMAYNRFIKANPNNPMIPKAYFLAARVFNEKLKNPKKAVGILNGLIKGFPNHEIAPYAQQYLRQIGA